jgi:Helix-turn-helix domain
MANSWIPIGAAVELSGYHAESIRKLVRAGKIKARKFGIVWQINRASLVSYLRGQAHQGEKRGPKPLT